MAQATIGTKLEYKNATAYVEITDVQSIPEIGGDAQEIDVTNLTDTETSTIPGVKSVGALPIVLFFNNKTATDNYRVCKGLEDAGKQTPFRISYPDGTAVEFDALCTTKIGGSDVNNALLFTLSLYKKGAFKFTNPAP